MDTEENVNEKVIRTYCCKSNWKLFHVENKGYFLCCSECGKKIEDQVGEESGISFFVVSKNLVRKMDGLFD